MSQSTFDGLVPAQSGQSSASNVLYSDKIQLYVSRLNAKSNRSPTPKVPHTSAILLQVNKGSMSLMKWLRRLAWGLLALLIAAVAVRPVRKGLELVALEATGEIQDFSWTEMSRFLHRGSAMNADRMRKTKDPYSSIFAPPATPERVQAGHQLFRTRKAPPTGGLPLTTRV
ncbi:MAG: hypothetical protein DMG97_13290 [Acidobacteria bacterium]|nr:MAG: hypothetical protein DMG98_10595 [Acidobacteriota bacterium]PYV72543.1 MAG: hypothetical protein DMG97_13290 [Acidobacteriota bacterium]PYV77404.1 MAG: hypothetical protein DMG96_11240 [Acidobacteriota bacterium]